MSYLCALGFYALTGNLIEIPDECIILNTNITDTVYVAQKATITNDITHFDEGRVVNMREICDLFARYEQLGKGRSILDYHIVRVV